MALLPHRMALCPRNQPDVMLIANTLDCIPAASIEWTQDVFGNLIATASFEQPSEFLAVTSKIVVEQSAHPWPVFAIAPFAHDFPFSYSSDDGLNLGILRVPSPDGETSTIAGWVDQFRSDAPLDTLTLLKSINAHIAESIAYRVRDEEGTQPASETIDRKSGSCRDMATLFIESARHLGLGARAVSGYAFDPVASGIAIGGRGTTHAWAEVYLPGAGWIPFDPTASRVGNTNLIPVATARSISQISPIAGHYTGEPEDFLGMDVDISIFIDKDGREDPVADRDQRSGSRHG